MKDIIQQECQKPRPEDYIKAAYLTKTGEGRKLTWDNGYKCPECMQTPEYLGIDQIQLHVFTCRTKNCRNCDPWVQKHK